MPRPHLARISPVSCPYLALQESDELIKIVCEIYVAADSQKGIVIGKGGKALKAVGIKARSRMEAFFGKKVPPPPEPCLEVTPRTFRGPPLPGFYEPPLAPHRPQVFLETRVKVSKSWRNNEDALSTFGYL